MSRLLVSVRGVEEAAIALEAGVHLLDVKEPLRGPLGAADFDVIRGVIQCTDDRVPISAALGELCEWDEAALPRLAELRCNLRFAKFGLAGAAKLANWREALLRVWDAVPNRTSLVAVVYADWRAAAAPRPSEVLLAARHPRCAAVLLDTWDKSAGDLLAHWPVTKIAELINVTQSLKLLSVVGGSLDETAIRRLDNFTPDYFAVRGAACVGGRGGQLDAQRIGRLLDALSQAGGWAEKSKEQFS